MGENIKHLHAPFKILPSFPYAVCSIVILESSGVYPAFNKAPRQALFTISIANLLNSSNLFLSSSSFVNCK